MWPFTDPLFDEKIEELLGVLPAHVTPQLASSELMRRASLHHLRVMQAWCIATTLLNLAVMLTALAVVFMA